MSSSDGPQAAPPAQQGFWARATVALALVLYAWSMIGVELYLLTAKVPEGPARALSRFRRLVMGRGVIGLGAAAVLAAIILALYAKRRRGLAWVAIVLAALWIACVAILWPRL